MTWNPAHLPDQTGRTIVVTGATAGIGYFAAEQLAAAGADVVLASRSAAKLRVAEDAGNATGRGAKLDCAGISAAALCGVSGSAAGCGTLRESESSVGASLGSG